MPNLNPQPQFNGVRRFEPSDTNHANVLNVVPQGFLNQVAWLAQELSAIEALQGSIETQLTQLETSPLPANTNNLISLVGSELNQNAAADSNVTAMENLLQPTSNAADVEIARINAIQSKLNGITIGTTHQAQNATLSAIAAATRANNTYLYRNSGGATSWSAISGTSSGTRMRDCILKGTIASGNVGPALATNAWTNAPSIVQTYNNAAQWMSWDSVGGALTLSAGEYLFDGLFAARGNLIQMALLLDSSSGRFFGTSGKGTIDSAIVSASEPLVNYSHLLYSARFTTTQVLRPQYYVSTGGGLNTNTMSLPTLWYFLRITYFQY